jgi:hypothetical protein
MVEKHVSIKSIVVEAFQIFGVLQVFFELHYCAFCIGVVVNEQSRSIAKIYVRPNENLGANNGTVADGTLLFRIDIDCFSVPRMDSLRKCFQYVHNPLRVFPVSDYGSPFYLQILDCLINT